MVPKSKKSVDSCLMKQTPAHKTKNQQPAPYIMSIQSFQSINGIVDAAAGFLAKGALALGGSSSTPSISEPKKGGYSYVCLTLALGILGLAYARRDLLTDGLEYAKTDLLKDGLAYAKKNLLTRYQHNEERIAELDELIGLGYDEEAEDAVAEVEEEEVEDVSVEEHSEQNENDNPRTAPVYIKSTRPRRNPHRIYNYSLNETSPEDDKLFGDEIMNEKLPGNRKANRIYEAAYKEPRAPAPRNPNRIYE